jgi:hypothetical protein
LIVLQPPLAKDRTTRPGDFLNCIHSFMFSRSAHLPVHASSPDELPITQLARQREKITFETRLALSELVCFPAIRSDCHVWVNYLQCDTGYFA